MDDETQRPRGEPRKSRLALAIALATIGGPVWREAPLNIRTRANRQNGRAWHAIVWPLREQRKRHFDKLDPTLRSLRTGMRELPDGFEFKFPADMKTYQLVAEWAAGERVCCPFSDIDLRAEREGGRCGCDSREGRGVKQFIETEGASWI